jgi:tetratricopeptide (TPR) repeat protein
VTYRSFARSLSPVLALVLLVEIAHPGVARADGQGGVQAVEVLTNQAYEFTSAGKYSEAIGAYVKAYEISRAAAILYNIATIYDRRMHERALAIEYFRRYLQAPDVDPEFARRATERLTTLKAEDVAEAKLRTAGQVGLPPPAATPAPAPAAPEQPVATRGTGVRTAGLVVGAIGIVGMGVALGIGGLAKSKNDDASEYCYDNNSSCRTAQGITLEQQAASFATASTVTFVAGATFLVAGVTLFLVAPHSSTAASITIQPKVGASSGGLVIGGTF